MIDKYADRWALVTGASAGIGAEFARQLAARGMHLVLVARREERLRELAKELDTRHGTHCEIITADLSQPEEPKRVYEAVAEKGITIELLVNNAGFGFVGVIEDTDIERMLAMIRLNVAALTELTYRYLPEMLQRGHGAIINVSSISAFQPVAYMPVYAATKAYVLHFSEALWAEARDRNVTVLALCPGTTQTEFFNVAGVPGWLKKHRGHSPKKVVRTALKAMEKKRQYVVPGWGNYFLAQGCRFARRKMVVLQSMRFFRPTKKSEEKNGEASQNQS